MMDQRAEVLRVAGETMTTAQFRVFVLHFFGGWTETEIARHYDVSQPTVHCTLWGQRKLAGANAVGGGVKKIKAALTASAGGGLMSKLGKALEEDEAVQKVLAEMKTAQPPSQRSTAGWFRGVPTLDFEARAILLVMHHIAGPSNKLHLRELLEEVPSRNAQAAMTRLKVTGWIVTNGLDIEIVKLPADPEETNDAA